MIVKNLQQIKKYSIKNYCSFCENRTKHVIHYVGEIQELVASKKWYVYLPLGSTDLKLYAHTETVGNLAINPLAPEFFF